MTTHAQRLARFQRHVLTTDPEQNKINFPQEPITQEQADAFTARARRCGIPLDTKFGAK